MTVKTSSMLSYIRFTDFLWTLFGLLVFMILFLSLNKEFSFDEIELVHTSWKILRGEKLYVDFFQHHHPLLYYLMVPVVSVTGENITTLFYARIAIFFLLILIFVFTYRLSVKVFDKETGIIGLVFLSVTQVFITRAIEIRPDVPQTLFNLFTLFYLFTYLKSKNLKHLILSSLASGIAFLFLQKALAFNCLIVILLLFNAYKKIIRYYDLFIYLFVFLLSLLPYLFYLAGSNTIDSYFIFNWILNVRFLDRAYPFHTLMNSFKVNALVWLFFVLGLFCFNKTPTHKQFGFITFSLLVFIFLARKEYEQYFMPVIPLIVIVSSYAVSQIFKNSKTTMALVLILSILVSSYSLSKWINEHKNTWQLQKINYVLSITNSDDFVYDGNVSFNLFRKDIDFFWYSLGYGDGLSTYQSIFDYDYDIYKLISKYKPKVISNHFIDNMNDDRITKYYRQSDLYEDLFIRVNTN